MTSLDYYKNAAAAASTVWIIEAPKGEPKVWLNDGATSRLGDLLHTEVGHVGRCYVGRVVRSTPLAILAAAAGVLAYSTGRHGDVGEAVARWSEVDPLVAVLAVAAALVLCGSAVFVRHLLWHHDEAPYAGNEVTDFRREVPRG